MSNIVLIGFMGSGKSTIAKELAKVLDLKVVDMDSEIEREEGRSITDIFAEEGEGYFRDLETSYLERCQGKKNKIISTGGGIVTQERNTKLLHNIGTVVFLQADVTHIMNNVKGDTKRPLLQEEDVEGKINSMLEIREPMYLSVANVIIQTSGKPIKNIVDEIVSIL